MNRTQAKTLTKELVSIITASSVGTIIEWYDFYIFASLATVDLSEKTSEERNTRDPVLNVCLPNERVK